jgi:prepilin-type N-terminal cleavage/methylation domain-containing protein
MNCKAFSLIELMVVIAIVAILAAVAYPAYKSYLVRTKMISVVRDLDYYTNMMIKHAQLKGKFPSAAELNAFPSTQRWANTPASVNKYITNLEMDEWVACGRVGNIRMDISPSLIGLPEMDQIILAPVIYHVNGSFIVHRTFMLHRSSPASFVPGNDYKPGPDWFNTREDAAGTSTNWTALYTAASASSTCI